MRLPSRWTLAASLTLLALPCALVAAPLAAPALALAAADSSLAASDTTFLQHAIMGDHAAIDAANLVLGKTTNDHTKQLAQTVVDTHTKMLEQLESEGKAAGASVPDSAGPSAKAMGAKLQTLQGKALDHAFVNDMVQLHTRELHIFQAEASSGKSDSLKKLAQDQLPVIQQHLTDLHGIQKNGL